MQRILLNGLGMQVGGGGRWVARPAPVPTTRVLVGAYSSLQNTAYFLGLNDSLHQTHILQYKLFDYSSTRKLANSWLHNIID